MKEEDAVREQLDRVLKSYNYKLGYEMEFPIYKILPDEVKLALLILQKHGMKVSITIKPKDK